MAARMFRTRDNRVIHVGRGQIKADSLAGNLETIRLQIGRTTNGTVVTDLTPREVFVLASLLLDAYRRTLPSEEDFRQSLSTVRED